MSESAPGRANSDSTASDKNVCLDCGKEYAQTSALQYHYRTDTNACSGLECPECGRDDFTAERGVKNHYGWEHEGTIAGEVFECDWCGKEYRDEKPAGLDHTFCSLECYGNYFSEKRRGENNPNWEGGKVTVECEWCGEAKTINQYYAERSNNHFCGQDCMGKWRSENIVGENHPNYRGGPITKICKQCESEFDVKPWHEDKISFCSRDCYGVWLSEHKSGENNPLWKGGSIGYYGPNWEQQKRRARKRDQHRCQRCRVTSKELSQEPDVHHKKPIRWFKSNLGEPQWYEKANDLDNLITLCRDCHTDWEGIPLDLDVRLGKS